MANYNLKIIKTEPLEVDVFLGNYETVKGAKQYIVELTNKDTGRKESQVIVRDKYYYNKDIIPPNTYSTNFISNREYYERHDKLIALLNNYSSIKYNLIDDETKSDEAKVVQYGYIYSYNISDLESFLNTISKREYEYYWDFIITNNINEYNWLINNTNGFNSVIKMFKKTNTIYKVDLSYFNKNSNAIIENTSQGSSTCVNSVLIKENI